MAHLTVPVAAAPPAVGLRAGVTLALALAGLAALALQADAASPQAAMGMLLAVALVVGAGGLAANLVRLPRRAASAVEVSILAPAPAADEGAGADGRPRILVAEANPLNQLLVHALLNGLVESLTIVSDGVEALEALRRQDFDLVLMDLNMPHLDGLGAVAAVRSGQAGRRDTPVVALTEAVAAGAADRLRAAGFDDHLAKPFEPAELLAIVAAHRGSRPSQGRRAAA